MGEVAAEAVELPDDEHVVVPECPQAAVEPRPVVAVAGSVVVVEVDLVDAGRLFEQTLEVAPQPRRHPLRDAGLDSAFRVDERIGAEPLDRRCGRQDGPRAPAGLDEPPDQGLVRLGLRCFFAEPLDELTRRAARARTGTRTGGAAPPDARAGSRPAPRSRRAPPRPGGAGGR